VYFVLKIILVLSGICEDFQAKIGNVEDVNSRLNRGVHAVESILFKVHVIH
jgi:hypothetical protein